jgi:hypothetical protein
VVVDRQVAVEAEVAAVADDPAIESSNAAFE